MSFFEAIKICFSKYVSCSGRSGRSEFWFFYLFITLGSIITTIIDLMVGPFSPLNLIFSLITLLPFLTVSVRRLHDVNRSGWWLLIPFTIIGIIPYAYWITKKSNPQENNFGPSPILK